MKSSCSKAGFFGSALLGLLGVSFSPVSLAQSNLTLYGRIVAGVDYSTNVSTDGKTSGSRISSATNQWGTSLFGFQGSEELGGGLKAVFDLESGFTSNNGATNGPALFNRFAYVGLTSKESGSIKLGNFLSISNDLWSIDPMGQQWLSSATLVRGRSWFGAPNSIQYESPDMGGFRANLQYSFGERPDSMAASSKGGVSLSYAGPGFELRAIYDAAKSVDGLYKDIFQSSQELIVGGSVKTGDAKWFAAYQELRAPNAPVNATDRARHGWIGVNYQISPALLLRAAAYHVAPNNAADSASLYTVGTDYSLSKRTLLYTTVGHVRNGNNATFSERYWEPHVAGENQTSVYFGVSHLF